MTSQESYTASNTKITLKLKYKRHRNA